MESTPVYQQCNSTQNLTNCTTEFPTGTGNSSMEQIYGLEAVPLAFAVIFIVGILGNSALLYYILRRRLCSPHNIYVINLAIGDIIMLSVSMPFVSTFYIFNEWPYGEIICKLNELVQTLCTAVTIFTIAALSVERYFIYTAHSPKKSRAFVVLFLIWTFAFLLAVPDLITANILVVDDNEYCLLYREEWGKTYKQVLTIIKFLFLFIFPLIFIITFYCMIAIKLRKRPKNIDNQEKERQPISASGSRMSYSADDDSKRRKLLTIIVICLVFAFICCWLPRHIYLIWFHFIEEDFHFSWFVFKTAGFCLMFANSSINPILFLIIDRRFRTSLFYCTLCNRQSYRPESIERTTFIEKQTIVMTDLTCNHEGNLV